MSALGAVVRHALDLGKYAFAVAFERERVYAPQHLPVGFRNGAWHGADSISAHDIPSLYGGISYYE